MVRVFLKGGVWKNSEDEILKAAVQKYGKQQWARVASLLNRKTAKQAKARWHEWLDPSIRKTEWSRSEEERLLELAKLMPAQWKTIAPMVGRTAVQCQEHYEYLLDQAAAAASSTAGGGGSGGNEDAQQQQQQLRPGQIDSHPETRPAKPDPIDMDEDEQEMLQEARARLANTQGKKAKRKQRERLLQSAKRLADLQKRRELKQAGLLSQTVRKKSKLRKQEIDLGVEIPFYKPAPAGFHSVDAELQRTEAVRQQRWKNVDYGKVNENQYRTRDREAAAAKKREEKRLSFLQDTNEKYAAAASAAKKQQPEEMPATAFRGSLQLPAPTTTDTAQQLLAAAAGGGGDAGSVAAATLSGAATQTLLGDYSRRPLPTPMRQQQSSTTQQDLMREASALRQLERGPTPLLFSSGKSGAAAAAEYNEDLDDDGITTMPPPPDSTVIGRATPGGSVMAATDDHSVSTFASSHTMSIRELARQERRAAKRARAQLEAALAALPAPQFEYELAVPETVKDDDEEKMQVVETMEADQADVEAAAREKQRLAAEKLYQARNSVMKRKDLPRPPPATTTVEIDDALPGDSGKMIAQEMQLLLQHDAHVFPMSSDNGGKKKKKKKKKRKASELMIEVEPSVTASTKPVQLEKLPKSALDTARQLVEEETASILNEKINAVINDGEASTRDDAIAFLALENAQVSMESAANMVYVPDRGWIDAPSEKDRIESLRYEFTTLQETAAAIKKKNDKLSSKLQVMNGGYKKRAEKLRDEILQTHTNLENAKIEETVYKTLQSHETQGGANRIQHLQEEIKQLRTAEAELQKKYGDLVVKKRRLQVTLSGGGGGSN